MTKMWYILYRDPEIFDYNPVTEHYEKKKKEGTKKKEEGTKKKAGKRKMTQWLKHINDFVQVQPFSL